MKQSCASKTEWTSFTGGLMACAGVKVASTEFKFPFYVTGGWRHHLQDRKHRRRKMIAGKDQEFIFGHATLILRILGHPSSSQTWLYIRPCPYEGG